MCASLASALRLACTWGALGLLPAAIEAATPAPPPPTIVSGPQLPRIVLRQNTRAPAPRPPAGDRTTLGNLLPARTAANRVGEVEFTGFVRSGAQLHFVLRDLERGEASDFLSFGQTFRGLTLLEFDATHQELTVRFGGEVRQLALKEAGKAAARPARDAEIVVDAQGRLFVAGERAPSPDLQLRLAKMAENLPGIDFNLIVTWPRQFDVALREEVALRISKAISDLPPSARTRYLSLNWRVAER